MNRIEVYFSLGSNQGDKAGNISAAIAMMEDAFGLKAARTAEPVITEPWGFVSDENFVNTAVCFEFPDAGQSPELHSLSVLRRCKSIEHALGRESEEMEFDAAGKRVYRSRPIDIDILLYGEASVASPELTIPHKDMYDRDFVMIPLRTILHDKTK